MAGLGGARVLLSVRIVNRDAWNRVCERLDELEDRLEDSPWIAGDGILDDLKEDLTDGVGFCFEGEEEIDAEDEA